MGKINNIKTGQILICDFERGFVPPEMVKKRPVIVVSKNSTHYRKLCTIVPLSTTLPVPIQPWHIKITNYPLKFLADDKQVWAKCDMLYTVSFDRLDRPHKKAYGKRQYLTVKLSADDLAAVFLGIRNYLPSEN